MLFTSFFTFIFYLICYISYFVSCLYFISYILHLSLYLSFYLLSDFYFCLGITSLLIIFLYIISFDKQLYIELIINQYKYLIYLFGRHNVYLAFYFFRSIIIYYPSIGFSLVYLSTAVNVIIVRPSNITYNTNFIQISYFSQMFRYKT